MNCKEIQELLLTDYLDKESDQEVSAMVNGHLEGCPVCQDFEKAVAQNTLARLTPEREIAPPEHVWSRIEESLRQREAQPSYGLNPFPWIKKRLPDIFVFPRFRYALATAFVIVLILAVFFPRKPVASEANAFLEEQADFMLELDSSQGLFGTDESFI